MEIESKQPHTSSLPQYHSKAGYGARRGGRKVFVGMSGGVDSSVAALLLKQDGYDVTGVYLKCWSQQRLDKLGVPGECPSERDAEDARRVANHLGIPFYVFDFEEEYRQKVVAYLIDGYRRGITPNPDVVCNREIKFGMFLTKALELGAEYVATGHYVRLRNTKKYEYTNDLQSEDNSYIRKPFVFRSLFEAKDTNKDQSYFLWTLTQTQLAHALFPVGDLLKSEVRDIARKTGLPTADKKDSQGICFLGDIALADFVAKHIPDRPGDIVSVDGTKVGEHRGTHLYTIGQRHLNANFQFLHASGGTPPKAVAIFNSQGNKGNRKPYYVSGIDVERNTITVAGGFDNPALFRKEVGLTEVNFVRPLTNYQLPLTVYARVRYRQPLVSAKLTNLQTYKLEFDQPIKFVAPGQSAVFYTEDGELLGGGVIL